MRIEEQRVAAEAAEAREAATRAAQARADREREAREAAERTTLAAALRERQARDEENARVRAHEAALLRIRSEAEARAQAVAQRLAFEHELALRKLHVDAWRAQLARTLGAVSALVAIGGALSYVGVFGPSLRSARIEGRAAQPVLAQQHHESEASRVALRPTANEPYPADDAAASSAKPASATGSATSSPPAKRDMRASRSPRPSVQRPPPQTSLIDIEVDDSDDPMKGIDDAPNSRKVPLTKKRRNHAGFDQPTGQPIDF